MFNQILRGKTIKKFVFDVFPMVDHELSRWISEIKLFGSEELAHQAMASIKMKKFHCKGGSIYSLYPGCDTKVMVSLITALQTISDYLDNLCDRTEIKAENTFRQLHMAFTDALQPDKPLEDYYSLYPFKDDGGYLNKLVDTCRENISRFPAYNLVKKQILNLGSLYSELQTYKHLDNDLRESRMLAWSTPYLNYYTDITNWEFAAATGSTLGIFMLLAIASDSSCTTEMVEAVFNSYFPWVCGLHILLDYLIDYDEDMEFGDLNFVSYYESSEECRDRMDFFIHKSIQAVNKLPEKGFHKIVIEGLLAMYLSDPKALQTHQICLSRHLVKEGGKRTLLLWHACKYLRKKQVL